MHTRKAITEALQKLGVQTGDLLMVHASLKAIGPVEGGAETVVAALRSAVGPTGTVMGYASWDRSPYEETLNGARLDDEARRTWLPFDPATFSGVTSGAFLGTVKAYTKPSTGFPGVANTLAALPAGAITLASIFGTLLSTQFLK